MGFRSELEGMAAFGDQEEDGRPQESTGNPAEIWRESRRVHQGRARFKRKHVIRWTEHCCEVQQDQNAKPSSGNSGSQLGGSLTP